MIFHMLIENVRIVTILYSKQNDTEFIIGEVFLTALDKELTKTNIFIYSSSKITFSSTSIISKTFNLPLLAPQSQLFPNPHSQFWLPVPFLCPNENYRANNANIRRVPCVHGSGVPCDRKSTAREEYREQICRKQKKILYNLIGKSL